MRGFRKDSENIRDTRIAYTLLLSLTVVCITLGIVSTKLSTRLRENELAGCYRSLKLCADALVSWEDAESGEGRYAAVMRFENAVATLPDEVELAPLAKLTQYMKDGADVLNVVRAYSETFSLLGSIEYSDGGEANSMIAKAVWAVGDAVGINNGEDSANSQTKENPPEVLKFSKKSAKESIGAIFGNGAIAFEPVLSEDNSTWYVETDNLRMTFSARDGRLEGFIYLRVGDGAVVGDGEPLSDDERLASVMKFFDSAVRYKGAAEASGVGELCGFLIADVSCGDDLYRAAVDNSGRVWSLMKVKR